MPTANIAILENYLVGRIYHVDPGHAYEIFLQSKPEHFNHKKNRNFSLAEEDNTYIDSPQFSPLKNDYTKATQINESPETSNLNGLKEEI